MSFATPLGLIALVGIPAVVALHLFRRRFEQRRVGGLFLFAPDQLRATAGRKRTRLLRSASLLCEVAAALLLALWLGGLAFGVSSRAVHVVLVLDDSVSMSAVDEGRSVADRVRDEIGALIDDLPSDAFATVILTGARPEILVGPRELASTVPGAIADWRPWRAGHDPGSALDLGVELAGSSGQMWFFSDRVQDAVVPAAYEVRALGVPGDNAAILAARRHRTKEGEQLFADLSAFGVGAITTSLSVHAVGDAEVKTLATREITLADGKPQHVAIDLPKTTAPISVQLGDDALAVDNEFLLFPQPERPVAVAVTLGERAKAALELSRVLRALPNVYEVEDAEAAHLVIGDDSTGSRHELRIDATAEESDTWLGPYLIERRDPLCDGLTLDGVVWSSGRREMRGFPVVLAGEQPLVTRDGQAERLRLELNLDPLRSNFATSPDWPILLTNVCDHVRSVLPGAVEPNVLVGGLLRWRNERGTDRSDLQLVDPFGHERPGRGLDLVTWRARYPGEHRLVLDGKEHARFSVNFADAHESDLRDAETRGREAEIVDRPERIAERVDTGRNEGRLLGLLLLVVVALDWFVLRRAGGRP